MQEELHRLLRHDRSRGREIEEEQPPSVSVSVAQVSLLGTRGLRMGRRLRVLVVACLD